MQQKMYGIYRSVKNIKATSFVAQTFFRSLGWSPESAFFPVYISQLRCCLHWALQPSADQNGHWFWDQALQNVPCMRALCLGLSRLEWAPVGARELAQPKPHLLGSPRAISTHGKKSSPLGFIPCTVVPILQTAPLRFLESTLLESSALLWPCDLSCFSHINQTEGSGH